jgi:hypothetical protein
VGCALPLIIHDSIHDLNWFRVRVEDGSDESGNAGEIDCYLYRSEIAMNGTVSSVDSDHANTGATYNGTTTLEMEVYDSGDTDYGDYLYSGKCFLPASDIERSKIFMWQANDRSLDTCPAEWDC